MAVTNVNSVSNFPVNTNRVPAKKISSGVLEHLFATYDEAAKRKPTTNDLNKAVKKLTTALREKGFPTNGVVKVENGIILVSADTKLTRDDIYYSMIIANINITWDHLGRFYPDLKLGNVSNGFYHIYNQMKPGISLKYPMQTNYQTHIK